MADEGRRRFFRLGRGTKVVIWGTYEAFGSRKVSQGGGSRIALGRLALSSPAI